ncbi:MAG: hypothetical protein R2770_16625 [Acidimicrobiales bacterium]
MPKRLVRLVLSLATAVLVIAALAGPASAQSVDRIAANLNDTGYYVEAGSGTTEADVSRAIASLQDQGVFVLVAALGEDPPDPEALARSLRDKTNGTVLLVTPGFISAASAVYTDVEVTNAVDASFGSFDDVGDGIVAFGQALPGTVAPVTTTTAATTQTTTGGASTQPAAESGGGGIGGVLIFFGVIIAAVVGLVLFTRSRNRKKVAAQMAQRKEQVKTELDAIGLDIVDLADRVTMADNSEATDHFRKGNDQFLELQEQIEAAKSLWEVTQVDYAADTAAWHLDAAEAIIEGDPVPDEPERPDLDGGQPAEPQPGAPTRAETDTPDREPSRSDQRERVDSRLDDRYRKPRRVEPRRDRRKGWEAPKTRGGGLGDVATGILVGGILRGGGGGRKPPKRWNGAGSLTSGSTGGSASRARSTSSGNSASRSRSAGGSATRRR